jgi:uncharacterized protein (TIGR03118 family)
MKSIRSSVIPVGLIVLSLSLSPTVCKGKPMGQGPMGKGMGHGSNNFSSVNLVSDLAIAKFMDPNLVNPWGMALSSSNTIFISDNGAGVSTEYNLDGTATGRVITIPTSASNTGGGNPTGIVANATPFFIVTKTGTMLTAPSTFIFVAEDGSISGWNPMLDPTHAFIAVDNGGPDDTGAVYKGATMGVANGHNFLFVTNFRSGKVETYDEIFNQVNTGGFVDPTPLPAGFAPFGIGNINGQIYVTYAVQDAHKHDDVAGPGNGVVNVFDTSGNFVRRLISNGMNSDLNSPWGLALHSAGFGTFNGELFVGNFGDGKINVYDPMTGTFHGTMMNHNGSGPLVFDGLWSLLSINVNLFFTAGINDEADGLFGVIDHGNSAHRHR